jgi:hypothetical protein
MLTARTFKKESWPNETADQQEVFRKKTAGRKI